MDKELEALQLRVQALELELQNNRNFVNAQNVVSHILSVGFRFEQ